MVPADHSKIIFILFIFAFYLSIHKVQAPIQQHIINSDSENIKLLHSMNPIELNFNLPDSILQYEFVIGSIEVKNQSNTSQEVSSRLNLFEGDIQFYVERPNGKKNMVHGAMMIDSAPKKVNLEPGQLIKSGIFLSFSNIGLTFEEIGHYKIRAEYYPGGPQDSISSSSSLYVGTPSRDIDEKWYELIRDEDVHREVAFGGSYGNESAYAKLQTLAEKYPLRREGIIAQLALKAAGKQLDFNGNDLEINDIIKNYDPITFALWVSAVLTPMSEKKNHLTKTLIEKIDQLKLDDFEQSKIENAKYILSQKPFYPE